MADQTIAPKYAELCERLTDPAYRGPYQHLRNWVELDSLHDDSATAIADLQAELERVKGALEFYADERRWNDYWRDALAAAFDRNCGSELGDDEGAKARAALLRTPNDRTDPTSAGEH